MTATVETAIIPVTQEHISAGSPCWSCDCPIALAILDAIPGAQDTRVRFGSGEGEYAIAVVAIDGRPNMSLLFGLDAYDFMHAFDDDLPVSPLTLVAEVVR